MSVNDPTWDVKLSELDVICKTLIDKMMKTVKKTLTKANMKKEDIEIVYLVGGSSRIKQVKETLRIFFDKEPVTDPNPDEVTAKGAAIIAAIESGQI